MKNKTPYLIARILLGIAFVFFGAIKFVPMENPPVMPQPALDFMMAMANTHYFIPFLALSEIALGILLLANRFVPLAMMILSPIMLNIILFNIFLGPSLMGVIFVGIPLALQVYIMYCTWSAYKTLFSKIKVT